MSFQSQYRPYGSAGAMTSICWWSFSCIIAVAKEKPQVLTKKQGKRCDVIIGRATCANWKMSFSVLLWWPKITKSYRNSIYSFARVTSDCRQHRRPKLALAPPVLGETRIGKRSKKGTRKN